MTSVAVVLKASYDAIMFVQGVLHEVDVNNKSVKFLAERLELLLPGIEKLMDSNPNDSTILLMAQGLCGCCMEAREFIEQFTKKGKHWVVDKARMAFNRNADKGTIADILTRIGKLSEDLNLGVTIEIQGSLVQLTQLFEEDTQKLQETLEGMQTKAAQRGDVQEQQHGEIRNAQEEIKRLIIASAEGSGRVSDSADADGSIYSQLPSLDDSYKLVVKGSLADCSIDDDDSASLGSGAHGDVFLMRGRFDGELYAAKWIRVMKAEQNGVDKKQLLQEGSNMQRLTHQNVIRMRNQCQRKKGKLYCLVMDYADQGTLDAYITKQGRVPTAQTRKWLSQLCAGLHHMHRECRMLHRDLKPQNILLCTHAVSGELIVRITDLGMASKSKMSQSKGVGTHSYMSPEKVMSTHYDEKDDMWAVGCILYELLTGQSISKVKAIPLIGLGMALEYDMKNGAMPTVVTRLLQPLQTGRDEDVDLLRLLARLLAYKPSERPAAKEAGRVARKEKVGALIVSMEGLQASLELEPIQPRGSQRIFLYDTFIGYRVATDSVLANELHDKCYVASAQHPEWKFSQGDTIKPYLDSKCLVDGEPWQDGFSAGLCSSFLFTPLLSIHEGDLGSVGQLLKLDPANGQDFVDNVLLEYELALAAQDYFGLGSFKIMPILLGQPDQRGYTEFPFHKLGGLSKEPSVKTKEALLAHCRKCGIPLSQDALQRSVQETVRKICSNQAVQLWTLGSPAVAAQAAADRIAKKASEVVHQMEQQLAVQFSLHHAAVAKVPSSEKPQGVQRMPLGGASGAETKIIDIVAMCSCKPADVSATAFETDGAHRLKAEEEVMVAVNAHILRKVTTKELQQKVRAIDPAIVHLAAHNQYKEGELRVIGFANDATGYLDTEASGEELAEWILEAAIIEAAFSGRDYANLRCIILNACKSDVFAPSFTAKAQGLPQIHPELRLICWPDLTDDIACFFFTEGFYDAYRQLTRRRTTDASKCDWVDRCFMAGLNNIPRRLKLQPALVRGAGGGVMEVRVQRPEMRYLKDDIKDDLSPPRHTDTLPSAEPSPRSVMVDISECSDTNLEPLLGLHPSSASAKEGAASVVGAKQGGQQYKGGDFQYKADYHEEQPIVSPVITAEAKFDAVVESIPEQGAKEGRSLHKEALDGHQELLDSTSEQPVLTVTKMEWRARVKDDEHTYERVCHDEDACAALVADVQRMAGAGATVSGLSKGSIIAHIISPATNFMAVREELRTKGPIMLPCGMTVAAVEVGDWIVVDTDVLQQLGKEQAQGLRNRFTNSGLERLFSLMVHSVVPNTVFEVPMNTSVAAPPQFLEGGVISTGGRKGGTLGTSGRTTERRGIGSRLGGLARGFADVGRGVAMMRRTTKGAKEEPSATDEVTALIVIRKVMGYSRWTKNKGGWDGLEKHADVGRCEGVKTGDEGTVHGLNLAGSNLTGGT
jgi:serine/threonine protein kinase